MKIRLALIISVLANIGLVTFIYIQRRTTPPPFDPFHIRTDFTYSDLISDGYTRVPVDVPMLGKTVGPLTINYQFYDEEEDSEVYYRGATILTGMREVDTLKIYKILESYDTDIIIMPGMKTQTKHAPPLSPRFFVKHRFNNQIFECSLTKEENNDYRIETAFQSPLKNDTLIEKEKYFWANRDNRFGPDTLTFDDGRTLIQNFWDWSKEGEEKLFRTNGTLELIRNYKDWTLQNTKGYYEDGSIEYDVLSYNMTGTSTWWYPTGVKMETIEYKDGKRNGRHVTYYSNGKVETSGQYIGGFYDTGIKDGDWIYYDSLGQIKAKEIYKRDSLIKKITY
jgi:antitoxin component YwqK of YwqJK toxin-antitoxin module